MEQLEEDPTQFTDEELVAIALEARKLVIDAERNAVATMLGRGKSWRDIAGALGRDHKTLYEKWAHLDPDSKHATPNGRHAPPGA